MRTICDQCMPYWFDVLQVYLYLLTWSTLLWWLFICGGRRGGEALHRVPLTTTYQTIRQRLLQSHVSFILIDHKELGTVRYFQLLTLNISYLEVCSFSFTFFSWFPQNLFCRFLNFLLMIVKLYPTRSSWWVYRAKRTIWRLSRRV